jgi:hypothetical protein
MTERPPSEIIGFVALVVILGLAIRRRRRCLPRTMTGLSARQARLNLSDFAAAELLCLELKEYCRQRATRPSRQTSLLVAIFAIDPTIRARVAAAAASARSSQAEPSPVGDARSS